MFDFERATDYIRSLELPGSTLCEEIQKDALAGDVPIIRPETASFLLFLISLNKPLSIIEGDAADILKTLDKPYDLIFMDAAKGQYIHFLPDVLRLLAPDGLLFSDNVLQDGDVLESRFAVTRRNRTIHSRMREYLTMLTHTPELTTSVIPIGDGVSLTMKKNTEEM